MFGKVRNKVLYGAARLRKAVLGEVRNGNTRNKVLPKLVLFGIALSGRVWFGKELCGVVFGIAQ